MSKQCPACGAQLPTPLACAACGALIDPPPGVSPWALLGLEPCWRVDAGELQKRLVRLSRLMHPDFFAAAPQAARDLAGRNSARLNDAYATLLDPARRTEWILADRGAPSAQAERTMPQSFLMQVLEWNESLDAARETQGAARTSALQSLLTELSPQREALLVRLGSLLEPLPAPGSPALLAARRELNALAYLDRALAQIENLRLSA